jgi:outer membrane protein assembly factor BamB
VFITTDDDRLVALEVATGKRVWDRERPRSDVWSDTRVITGQAGATLMEDRVLTGFSDGRVGAYSARDGASLWIRDLSGGETEFTDITSTPKLTIDGLVVLASFKAGLFGLDAKTGASRWQIKGEGFGTPATYDGVLYAPTASGKLLAIRSSNGDILWTLDGAGGPARRPAVTPRYVILPVDTALIVVDRLSGRSMKRYDDRHGFSATPEVAYGTAFVQSNSGVLYALGLH